MEKKQLQQKETGGKLRFIPYQRFIILLHIDKSSKPFYSNRFCRRSTAFDESEKMSMLSGINAAAFDTKTKSFIGCESRLLEIKIDPIFDGMEK